MKVEIRVGNISTGNKTKYVFDKFDNIDKEKERMYNFLLNSNNCIIENVDNFLLYTLNNGILAFIVKDNPELQKDQECNLIPKFDPNIYKIFQINDDGTETSIQDTKGNITKNYFNILMGGIMDDYYSCLNFLNP